MAEEKRFWSRGIQGAFVLAAVATIFGFGWAIFAWFNPSPPQAVEPIVAPSAPETSSVAPSEPTETPVTPVSEQTGVEPDPVPVVGAEILHEVRLGTLCARNEGGAYCSTRTAGTIPVGDSVFAYDAVSNDTGRGIWMTVATLPQTTCTSISLRFAVDDRALPLDDVAMLQVIQENSDAYYAEAVNGTIGSLDVILDGGTTIISADHTDRKRVRIAGVATCSTPNGY